MAKIDLSPKILDLVLYAGDGVTFRLVVADTDEAPVPLTGEIKAQIRDKRFEADTAEAEFAVNMDDAAEGIAILTLTGAQTQALVTSEKKFVGVWDVEWTPTGTQPRTIIQGKVECGPDVTR